MLNLKKQILNHKIKKIIKQYPFVLFIQCNNVTPKNWSSIKDKLSKLGIIKTLKIKNKIARQLLKQIDYTKSIIIDSNPKSIALNSVLQGKTLMIGCPIVEQLPGIHAILEKNKNLLFTGGLFQNQVMTHLDFDKIIKLDKFTFTTFIQRCSSPIQSLVSLQNFRNLSHFTFVQNSLLQTLNTHKELVSNLKTKVSEQ